MNRHPFFQLGPRVLAAILVMCLPIAELTSAPNMIEPVGEVALVLGQATVINSKGDIADLSRGSLVFEGSRIETASNGHVHIRFVDEALLSVRPNSTLEIEVYRFDIDNPGSSAVKLNLDEGVARAISGKASKAARQRFRLNTPVAAIGVRGTDFVVGADSGQTRALVNEGAIFIAPFSGTCSEDGLGPCTGDGLELMRDGLQLASLESGQSLPTLLAGQNIREPGALQRQIQRLTAPEILPAEAIASNSEDEVEGSSESLNNEVYLEAVTSPAVRAGAAVAAAKASTTDFLPVDPIVVSPAGQVQGFDYTPPSKLTATSLSDRQLVWGYYGAIPSYANRLALSFAEANETRRVSVGNLSYGLFRRDANPRRVASDLGLVGFQLASAQAVFNNETGIAVLRVDGGSLDINFQDRTFETMLSLGHDSLGQIEFSAVGKIFDGGFLRAAEATQRLAGAVSYDGSEAGYFFEKQLSNGLLSGLTLWDSK